MTTYNINSNNYLNKSYNLPNNLISNNINTHNYLTNNKYFIPKKIKIFHINKN